MVVRFLTLLAVFSIAGIATIPLPSEAGEVRFYKISKKSQQSEVRLVRNRNESGCHNFLRNKDIYRVAQVGFTYCTVFEQKDCPNNKGLVMEWRGKVKKNSIRSQPGERLMPGDLWFFKDGEEQTLRSWLCVKN
ncbi:MAG: hypothetical protein ACI8P9_003755 [Parasphingorhabdus sp.]|jgi:hypothetical protein